MKLGIGRYPFNAFIVVCMTIATLVLFGCPQPSAPPVPDADASPDVYVPITVDSPTPLSTVAAACANLQAAGCPEGTPACGGGIQKALDDRSSKKITSSIVDCISKAGPNGTAIRACSPDWCHTGG